MCISELWPERDKIRIAGVNKNKVVDINTLPMMHYDRDHISVFKPLKMEREKQERKLLVGNKTQYGIAKRLKQGEKFARSSVEQKGDFTRKTSLSVNPN